MTAAIIGILAAIIPFGIFLWKRRAARLASPEERLQQIHEVIIKASANDVNALLDDAIRGRPPTGDAGRVRDADEGAGDKRG